MPLWLPDPRKVAELPELCRQNQVEWIMFNKNTRCRRRLIIVFATAISAVFFFVGMRYYRLSEYGKFISKHCANELTLLENAASSDKYEDRAKTRFDLEDKLDKNLFYYARFSNDGHHVNQTIIDLPESISTFELLFAHPNDHSTVYYSKSASGKSLVTYDVWVPHAPVWRLTQLHILREELDRLMAHKEVNGIGR